MLKEDYKLDRILESVATNSIQKSTQYTSTKSALEQNIHKYKEFNSQFFNELLDDKSMSGNAGRNIEMWLSQYSLNDLHALSDAAKYEAANYTTDKLILPLVALRVMQQNHIFYMRELHFQFMVSKRV